MVSRRSAPFFLAIRANFVATLCVFELSGADSPQRVGVVAEAHVDPIAMEHHGASPAEATRRRIESTRRR
jgi:hypothetical protein